MEFASFFVVRTQGRLPKISVFNNNNVESGFRMGFFNSERDRGVYQWLFRLAALVIGGVVLFSAVTDHRTATRLKTVGRFALADPIDSYTRQIRAGSTVYTARVTFYTAAGRPVSQYHRVPKEAIDQFKRGAQVRVIYDPETPSRFAFENEVSDWSVAGMGAGLLLLGLLVL